MGTTNLLQGLERKYAHLIGEIAAKRDEIARIQRLVQTIPELEERVRELEEVTKHSAALLKHLDPDWEEEAVDPIRPFVHQLPIKLGDCSRKALDILRTAEEPMTAREIADEVLRQAGVFSTMRHVSAPPTPFKLPFGRDEGRLSSRTNSGRRNGRSKVTND